MSANAITKYTWMGYTAARSNLAYMGEAISRTTFLAVVLYILMKLWTVVYSGSGAQKLGGLTVQQMLWYLMITESILMSAPRVASEIDEDVRTGRLSVQLLRPMSYAMARLAQAMGERLVRFAVNFATGTVIAMLLVGPIALSYEALAMFALVLPLAFILDFLGYFTVGLCAFWLESTTGLSLIYTRLTMLLGGMLLPMEMFPVSVQPIVRALPFASMVYGPARVFVAAERSVFVRTVIGQIIALTCFGIVVMVVQRMALRRIESNGG